MEYGNPFYDRPKVAAKSKETVFTVNGVIQKRLQHVRTVRSILPCAISTLFLSFLQSNSPTIAFQRVNHDNLRMMFESHNRLMDLAQNINKCYASAFLVFVTGIFIFSIFGLFFETKVLFWSWEKSTKLILISTSPVLWVIAGLANVYVLLSVCESARSAAYETPLIVHKIMQKKPLFMLHDDTYYNKMKAFSIQVLHRKKTFNFSALGLFDFDYTFIFSVRTFKRGRWISKTKTISFFHLQAVSAATSFLIVLLQFDVKFE